MLLTRILSTTLCTLSALILLPRTTSFPIRAPPPGEDFPIDPTPGPGEEDGFATVAGAQERGMLQHLAALSYTDTVGGVRVTFGGAMLGAAGGSSGAASAGGRDAGAATAGSTGESGFGLGLATALGVQFGRDGPRFAAGAGATGGVGDVSMAAAGGHDVQAEAALSRHGKRSGLANAKAVGGLGRAKAVHGQSSDKNGRSNSAAGARVRRAGGASFITAGSGSGVAAMGSGFEAVDESDGHKPAQGTVGASNGAAGGGAVGAGRVRSARTILRGLGGNGTAQLNATAGDPGTAAGSVVTGDAQAQARGR